MGEIIEKFRLFRWGSPGHQSRSGLVQDPSKEKVPNSVGWTGHEVSFSVLRICQPVGQPIGKPFLFGLNRAEKVGNRRKHNGPIIHPVAPGRTRVVRGLTALDIMVHVPFFQIISFFWAALMHWALPGWRVDWSAGYYFSVLSADPPSVAPLLFWVNPESFFCSLPVLSIAPVLALAGAFPFHRRDDWAQFVVQWKRCVFREAVCCSELLQNPRSPISAKRQPWRSDLWWCTIIFMVVALGTSQGTHPYLKHFLPGRLHRWHHNFWFASSSWVVW